MKDTGLKSFWPVVRHITSTRLTNVVCLKVRRMEAFEFYHGLLTISVELGL